MSQERGGVYVQRGVDGDDEPILVHVDDLPTAERDAIKNPPAPAELPVRETRGGLYVDAPDEGNPEEREPPKHVDDMTPDEKESRLGIRGGELDLPIDLLRGR